MQNGPSADTTPPSCSEQSSLCGVACQASVALMYTWEEHMAQQGRDDLTQPGAGGWWLPEEDIEPES